METEHPHSHEKPVRENDTPPHPKEPAPSQTPRTIRYSVKFICGTHAESCGCEPISPGRYSTLITIHNPSSEPADIRKHFIPLVLAGAPIGREPNAVGARAHDAIKLPPLAATMDDCCRITTLLFGAPVNTTVSGILEIIASREVRVTAVYTHGSSVDVESVVGHAV